MKSKRKIYKTREEVESELKFNETLVPLYKKYKRVRITDRCHCCDHKVGSHFEKWAIGKPYGYYKREKSVMEMVAENMFMDHMIAMNRVIDPSVNLDLPITFRRYKPLKK